MLLRLFVISLILPSVATAQFAASLVLEAGEDRLVVAPGQVADISAGISSGGPGVDVRLLHMPAERLRHMTETHRGGPLSVQLCRQEIARQTLVEANRTGRVRLPAPSLAAAETLAAILDGRAGCEEIAR